MSDNPALDSLKGTFMFSWGLLGQFIEICPEPLWAKKFGGWPLWQNIYHALTTIEFFVRQEGDPSIPGLYSHEVASLAEVSAGPAPSRQELKDLHAKMQILAKQYFAGLDDTRLGKDNAGLSSRMPAPWTHASTCAMLSGHTLYHLGIADAALREEGLKGVF